jgi:hypothetical protein
MNELLISIFELLVIRREDLKIFQLANALVYTEFQGPVAGILSSSVQLAFV